MLGEAGDPREHLVARLFDLAEQPIENPSDELTFPVHDSSRDQQIAGVRRIRHRHNRAWHVVIGHLWMDRASSSTMSASFPGASAPTLFRRRLEAAPAMVAISIICRRRHQLRHRPAARVALRNVRSLARARCRQNASHQRERIGGHIGLDVRAEAGQDAVVQHLLEMAACRAASASRLGWR